MPRPDITRPSPKPIQFLVLAFLFILPAGAWLRVQQRTTLPAAIEQKTDQPPAKPVEQQKTEQQKTEQQQKDDEFTIRTRVDEVQIYATVLDDKNNPVAGLPQEAFTVYEDGVKQKLTSFRNEDIPISMGLLIDNSASMSLKRNAVMDASLTFVKTSNPQDEVFVVNFNDQPILDQDFTSKISLLKDALSNVNASGGTAVYDSVVAATRHLVDGGVHDKKVLLIITDGVDNMSGSTLEEAITFVQSKAGPMVYAVGLFADENKHDKKMGTRALNRMTQETGGLVFYPKKLDEVEPICRNVAKEIRAQYALGYKSSRPQNEGGFRTLRVEIKSVKGFPRNLQVRTRTGYYAGQKLGVSPPSNTPPAEPKKP